VGYDMVVHFGLDLANPSVQIVLNIVNAKQRFLFLKHPTKPLPNDVVMDGDWHSPHYSARHQRFLETLGASAKPYRYDIRTNSAKPATTSQGLGSRMVINSQSSTANRSLSIVWLREFVAMALQQHADMHIELLSASAAHEAQQREAFADFADHVSVIACQPSVSHALAVIQTADVVVSPDTYAVHAAGAWNIPVLALYEPSSTTMDLWGPVSDNHVQLCAPEGQEVSDIGIQVVCDALSRLLTTPQIRQRVMLK
jgi:ADP-heptose:LPS heptosyltransferase